VPTGPKITEVQIAYARDVVDLNFLSDGSSDAYTCAMSAIEADRFPSPLGSQKDRWEWEGHGAEPHRLLHRTIHRRDYRD
jgi:hypothetical protein